MSNLPVSNQQAFSPRMIGMKLLPTLIYAAIVPYLIYLVATGSIHLSEVNALLLAAITPVFGVLIELMRKRRLSLIGSFTLVGIAVKLLSALLFNDARLVLISHSLMIGVFGLLMLGSVLIGKPVLLVLIKSGFGDMSQEQRAQLERSFQSSGAHRRFLLLTTIWGMALLLMLVVCVILTYTLPIAQVILLRPVIDYGIIAALIAGSLAFRHVLIARKRQQNAH
ncbi:hypothetical protein KSF_104820 [Reticulibacter mediterranei]|uniref:Intracellular septation protein A n=1 Tax=Reticulibacter mediterranei TaxID=2778369 RepID=A0A8J3N6R3_9CHLR|nr:VC0807 family protein [Reticulibacter mediterranei]GHP00435.1 hypothetical protein KSF_104820 [Reticulibacter mediterranei]